MLYTARAEKASQLKEKENKEQSACAKWKNGEKECCRAIVYESILTHIARIYESARRYIAPMI